jgi:hypothetical protein
MRATHLYKKGKQTPRPLVCMWTIPIERPLLIGEVSAKFCWYSGVAWSAQRFPTAINLSFLERSPYFSFMLFNYPREGEWTPLQTHSFLGNLVAPGIEPQTFGFVATNSHHKTTEAVLRSRHL